MLDTTSPSNTGLVTLGTIRSNAVDGFNVGVQAAVVLVVAYGTIAVIGFSGYGIAKGAKAVGKKARTWARNHYAETPATWRDISPKPADPAPLAAAAC